MSQDHRATNNIGPRNANEEYNYEPEHDPATLKQKIRFLEEELVRKEKTIEHLKQENELLFKTALKKANDKADRL
jgi:hypothetical protein